MSDDYNSGMLHVQQGGSSRFARPLVMALSLLVWVSAASSPPSSSRRTTRSG